jgi:murein DD-endopeptidase MepM/ murein hydrolase activator NlpD
MKITGIKFILILALLASFLPIRLVAAQATGAYYVVQEGENLSDIARYFHTTLRALTYANYIADPNLISPGKRLFIPGFEDLSGEIVRNPLPANETPHTLSRALRQGEDLITRLNTLMSPDNLYAGERFFQLKQEDIAQTRLSLTSGLTAIDLAMRASTNPWTASLYNELDAPWRLVANDVLFLPGVLNLPSSFLPAPDSLALDPSPILQGKTILFRANAGAETTLGGRLLGYPLHFFPASDGSLVALQGIPRLADPGLVPLIFTAQTPDGRTFTHQQNLLLKFYDYGYDAPLSVKDNEVDPEVTEPEFALLMENTADAPPEKLWSGKFQTPVPEPSRITSNYGRLRSFNGSDYVYFHSGIDYGGTDQTPILAPADGIVVFAGELTVRGNATIISHGWGVYTGYWHQSRIDVKVGDHVTRGQTIGMVGNTGRVTGPHLHFDVIVGNVEVDPEEWLKGWYGNL